MGKLGLGKGLDALMGDAEFHAEHSHSAVAAPADVSEKSEFEKKIAGLPGLSVNESGDLLVDVALLQPNPHQPRTEFDDAALAELSESIREHGVIQPVLIEDAGNGFYYIIAGERRTRAARLAGLTKIPVRLRNFSEERKLEVALIENIQRENLNPVEEAVAYRNLMELANLNQDEVARRVGKNRSTVANALRLLKLPEDMQASLSGGQITAGHARALLSVANPSDQRVLFARIVGMGLSVRDAEQYAAELNGGARAAAKPKKNAVAPVQKDPDMAYIEQQFIEKLGTKVSLKGSFSRGSVQIEYFSREDLDRLYSLIVEN